MRKWEVIFLILLVLVGVGAKLKGWGGPDEAKKVIQDSIKNAK